MRSYRRFGESVMSKTLLTGVKPTHIPHIGNYLGAIRPGIQQMQNYDHSLLFIADYHALNQIQDPKDLKEYTYQVAATWIAAGLDPKKSIMYRQSDIPGLFELNWILSTVTPKGFMNRAHAYKARVQENQTEGREDLDHGVSMGLYNYPVLMSADILAFDADVVPVGEDQTQHIEFARDIAQKFNRIYGEKLKLPKAHVQLAQNIPGLDGRKMSKSYGNTIPLFLDEKPMRKLVMKIVTDSTPPETPKETKGSILFDLYKEFAGQEKQAELAKRYASGIGWGEVKQFLFEAMFEYFKSKTDTYNRLMADKGELDRILKEGARNARELSTPVIDRVRDAIGVHPRD